MSDEIEYFDIVAEGTDGEYNSEIVELLRQYALERISEFEVLDIFGAQSTKALFSKSTLEFLLTVKLDNVIRTLHKMFTAYAEKTQQSLSTQDDLLLQFALYIRNLTYSTRIWYIYTPRVGSAFNQSTESLINPNAPHGRLVKRVLVSGIRVGELEIIAKPLVDA